jgi:hypothetical protein
MSEFKVGESSFKCRYLFSKDLIDDAKTKGIRLHRQASDKDFDDAFVTFVCENVVYDWANIYDLDDNELDFDTDYLYQIFENHPKIFINLLRYCSKADNFELVSA